LKPGANTKRRDLPVDWKHLQKPGFSPDFIDKTEPRFDLAYDRNDWIETPMAVSLKRNNMPLLGSSAARPSTSPSRTISIRLARRSRNSHHYQQLAP